jgi:putative integral membrane protein (TIGR02587 family)
MDLSEISGKIAMEAMTVAIGVSVGTAQLGADDEGDEGLSGEDGRGSAGYLPQAAIALCGAVLFAANVAPTEEIQVIAMESHPANLLLLAIGSITLGGLVLHFAWIHGHRRHVLRDSIATSARGVITTYAVAMVAGAGCLFFFGQFDGQPWRMMLAQTVVIGVPAVLGASAGRLLLQARSPGT